MNNVLSHVRAHAVTSGPEDCLLLSSRQFLRCAETSYLPPVVLTLLPFPVQCHDRSLKVRMDFRSELDNHCRALSAEVHAFPQGCLVPCSIGTIVF